MKVLIGAQGCSFPLDFAFEVSQASSNMDVIRREVEVIWVSPRSDLCQHVA